MSVRAYRIDTIKYSKDNTFNLWHDYDTSFCHWLNDNTNFYSLLNDDACGISEVSVTDLKKAIVEVKDMDVDTKKSIINDIKFAEKKGDDYVQYSCY